MRNRCRLSLLHQFIELTVDLLVKGSLHVLSLVPEVLHLLLAGSLERQVVTSVNGSKLVFLNLFQVFYFLLPE